jgi:hypothetical protein
MAGEIDGQVTDRERSAAQPVAGEPFGTAEQGFDPQHHLPGAERLDHVVVSSGLQTDQPILLLAPRRQDEHRGVVPGRPLAPQHLQSGDRRQQDVEDDHVRPRLAPGLQGLPAVPHPVGLIPGPTQVGQQDTGHGVVVLDH